MPDKELIGWFERTRGRPMVEVHMRPGDVLYVPRGWYHDAMAQPGASLHVTFSVTPLHGGALFGLLETLALEDPAFRAWLEPAEADAGEALARQLADLGGKLTALAQDPRLASAVAIAQQKLIDRPPAYGLPHRKPLTGYRRTTVPPPPFTGPVAVAMQWAFGQPDFAIEDLRAQFTFVATEAIDAAVETALKAGALTRA